jgi:hypothetical protein
LKLPLKTGFSNFFVFIPIEAKTVADPFFIGYKVIQDIGHQQEQQDRSNASY